MYNLNSHYENILSYTKSIITQPTVVYLHPFGSTQPENIESLQNGGFGPLIIAYDQEPLYHYYNSPLFTFIKKNFRNDAGQSRPTILLTTEKEGTEKNKILQQFQFGDANYFFHGLAASDWYRGYQYCNDLVSPAARHNILSTVKEYNLSTEYILKTKHILDSIKFPLRIDSVGDIPNGSQTIGPISALMESFLHVVTETCFWDQRTHLTEKIFKPIVARQPFVLVGCAGNLKYLQSYGFKTFDRWWDESYDEIQDPILRLEKIVDIINEICSMNFEELQNTLQGMKHILDHNYELFYSRDFVDSIWNEMAASLQSAIVQQSPQTLKENSPLHCLCNLYYNTLRECHSDKLV